MTREDIVEHLQEIIVKMKDYQWAAAYRLVKKLHNRLTETPADIEWDEYKIRMR